MAAKSTPIVAEHESCRTYSCHFCTLLAREAVISFCGHIYCWSCLNTRLEEEESRANSPSQPQTAPAAPTTATPNVSTTLPSIQLTSITNNSQQNVPNNTQQNVANSQENVANLQPNQPNSARNLASQVSNQSIRANDVNPANALLESAKIKCPSCDYLIDRQHLAAVYTRGEEKAKSVQDKKFLYPNRPLYRKSMKGPIELAAEKANIQDATDVIIVCWFSIVAILMYVFW